MKDLSFWIILRVFSFYISKNICVCIYVCIINKYVWEKAYVGFHGTYLSITATWRSQSNDLFHKQEYFILFCWMFKSKAHLKKNHWKRRFAWSWGRVADHKRGKRSVPNSSDGLIFVKSRAKDGRFFSKNTGVRRAKRRAKLKFLWFCRLFVI